MNFQLYTIQSFNNEVRGANTCKNDYVLSPYYVCTLTSNYMLE